jgi:hypothetical protein
MLGESNHPALFELVQSGRRALIGLGIQPMKEAGHVERGNFENVRTRLSLVPDFQPVAGAGRVQARSL